MVDIVCQSVCDAFGRDNAADRLIEWLLYAMRTTVFTYKPALPGRYEIPQEIGILASLQVCDRIRGTLPVGSRIASIEASIRQIHVCGILLDLDVQRADTAGREAGRDWHTRSVGLEACCCGRRRILA